MDDEQSVQPTPRTTELHGLDRGVSSRELFTSFSHLSLVVHVAQPGPGVQCVPNTHVKGQVSGEAPHTHSQRHRRTEYRVNTHQDWSRFRSKSLSGSNSGTSEQLYKNKIKT